MTLSLHLSRVLEASPIWRASGPTLGEVIHHNILPTMALGAVDTEAAEAVMFGSENFVPEKPEEEAECESEYCDGGDPYPNAEEEAEAMSVLKRALCDEQECLVEDDEDVDWNDIAALLAEEQS